VEHLEKLWSLRFGEVLTGGSESLVVEAVRKDGTKTVLKIALSGSADLTMEARVYQLVKGRGYAYLIEHDEPHNSLLLERLGSPLAKKGFSVGEQIAKICTTLNDAWILLGSSNSLTAVL